MESTAVPVIVYRVFGDEYAVVATVDRDTGKPGKPFPVALAGIQAAPGYRHRLAGLWAERVPADGKTVVSARFLGRHKELPAIDFILSESQLFAESLVRQGLAIPAPVYAQQYAGPAGVYVNACRDARRFEQGIWGEARAEAWLHTLPPTLQRQTTPTDPWSGYGLLEPLGIILVLTVALMIVLRDSQAREAKAGAATSPGGLFNGLGRFGLGLGKRIIGTYGPRPLAAPDIGKAIDTARTQIDDAEAATATPEIAANAAAEDQGRQ